MLSLGCHSLLAFAFTVVFGRIASSILPLLSLLRIILFSSFYSVYFCFICFPILGRLDTYDYHREAFESFGVYTS